jgi:hypothetical protein
MTTGSLRAELGRRAMPLADDLPDFALEEAVREVVDVIATARLGEAREGELGEVDPAELDTKAAVAADKAGDVKQWPHYLTRARRR